MELDKELKISLRSTKEFLKSDGEAVRASSQKVDGVLRTKKQGRRADSFESGMRPWILLCFGKRGWDRSVSF